MFTIRLPTYLLNKQINVEFFFLKIVYEIKKIQPHQYIYQKFTDMPRRFKNILYVQFCNQSIKIPL